MTTILKAFESTKEASSSTESSSSSQADPSNGTHDALLEADYAFFPKYLTSPTLFQLEVWSPIVIFTHNSRIA